MSTASYPSSPITDKTGEGRRLLLIFGVLLILLGCLCALVALSFVWAAVQGDDQISPALSNLPPEVNPNTFILQFFLLMAFVATLLICTGVGSLRLRRWVRPIVISSAGLFLFGVLVALLQFAIPDIRDHYLKSSPTPRATGARYSPPAPTVDAAQDLTLCAMAVAGIGIPLLFLYAYRSRAVQLALNENGLTVSWVDRAPIPVLALAIALGWTSFLSLIGLIPSPVPYFFEDAYPILDWVFFISLGLFLALGAVVVYRQHSAGTFMAVVSVFLIGLSTLLSESHAIMHQARPYLPGQAVAEPELIATSALLAALAQVIPALAYIVYANSKMSKH